MKSAIQPRTHEFGIGDQRPIGMPAGNGGFSWVKFLLPACVLLAMTLVAFLPVLSNQFVDFDDDLYVTANPHVHAGLKWESIAWAFHSTQVNNWHPLTWISHIVDWQLFGANPWGHHLTSLVFHTINALLLLLLLFQISGSRWRSFFVASLFAINPLRVESVAWVAERKDVLSTCFGLLSIWVYTKYVEHIGPGRRAAILPSGKAAKKQQTRTAAYYLLALLFFICSLMSKPMLVTLPFVFLLLDYWPLSRIGPTPGTSSRMPRWLLDKIPFLVGSLASSWIALIVQRAGGAMTSLGYLTLTERLANVAVSYCRYIAKLFFPGNLAVFYPYPGHWPLTLVLACTFLLSIVTILAIALRKRSPYGFVGWFWFAGTLIPVAGLVQVGRQAMADRYSYFPSIGIGLIVVWGLWPLTRQ